MPTIVETLDAAGVKRIVICQAPPPLERNEDILRLGEVNLAHLFKASGITPASIRLKTWRLQCMVIEEICRILPVSLIECPKQAKNKNGFLASKFFFSDCTHANRLYGDLVLREAMNALEE